MEIWAHRGASAIAPENTMAAFVKAYEQGADGIELDIHRTTDGVLIVMHDEHVARTTTGRGYLHSAHSSWVKTLDAGVRFHPQFAGEKVPTLEEVLAFLRSTTLKLNVEMKNQQIHYSRMEEDLLTLLKNYGMLERTVISSFNHDSLRKLKLLDAQASTAVLCTEFRPAPLPYALQMGASAIHPSYKSVNPDFLREARRAKLAIRPYTVDDELILRTLNHWGADGVITNRPDLARRVIG